MDRIPTDDPMEKPPQHPLAGLDPADLLKQGVAGDTFIDEAASPFNPPTVDELASQFPQFEILGLIGKGGMGAVYKVRQPDLDRIVALKILPPAIGEAPGFSDRFAREAKALAKLNHPGIVTIHEFGQQSGLYFILMEFVDGVNLAQLMQTGRVSPREALAIVPQICDALQFAHDQGIVHRDIKPENILLDRLGRVKVADFGIAKVVAAVCEDPIRGGDIPVPTEATIAGKVMGTPAYMAPEQIDHPADVDHRADIYALGVVFYQMLTGELPGKEFQAPSKKVHIDVRLDEIVLRAMEKDPELRYQQVSVMKTMVEETNHRAKRSSPWRFSRWTAIACFMLLGLPIVMAVGLLKVSMVPNSYQFASLFTIGNEKINPDLELRLEDVVKSEKGTATLDRRGPNLWRLYLNVGNKNQAEEANSRILKRLQNTIGRSMRIIIIDNCREVRFSLLDQKFIWWLQLGALFSTVGLGWLAFIPMGSKATPRSWAGNIALLFFISALGGTSLMLALPEGVAFGWGFFTMSMTAAVVLGIIGWSSRLGRSVVLISWLLLLAACYFGMWSWSGGKLEFSLHLPFEYAQVPNPDALQSPPPRSNEAFPKRQVDADPAAIVASVETGDSDLKAKPYKGFLLEASGEDKAIMEQKPKTLSPNVVATSWLGLVDEVCHGVSWQSAAKYFQASVSEETWLTAVELRRPLGPVVERKILDITGWQKDLSQHQAIRYTTRFYMKNDAVIETVHLREELDGKWSVISYFIK